MSIDFSVEPDIVSVSFLVLAAKLRGGGNYGEAGPSPLRLPFRLRTRQIHQPSKAAAAVIAMANRA